MKNIIISVILIAFVAPVIRVGSFAINGILVCVPMIIFLFAANRELRVFVRSKGIHTYLWLILVYFYLQFAFCGGIDSYAVTVIMYSILIFYCIAVMYWYTKTAMYKLNTLLILINVISIVNILSSILFIVFPSYLDSLSSYIVFNYEADPDAGFLNRAYGFFSYGGAVLSVYYALIIVVNYEYLVLRKWLKHVLTFVFLVGIVISARTGLLFVAAYYFYSMLRSNNYKTQILVITSFCICIYVLYENIESLVASTEFGRVFYRAFEALYKLKTNGAFETDSSNNIIYEQYGKSLNVANIIFGDGNYGRNAMLKYIASDSFYYRFFSGAGIVGTSLIAGSLLYLRNANARHFSSFLITITLIINIKEPFIFGILGYSHLAFLIYFINDDRKQKVYSIS